MLDFLVCVFLFLFDNKSLSEYLLCIITQLLSYLASLFIAKDILDICWYQGLNRGIIKNYEKQLKIFILQNLITFYFIHFFNTLFLVYNSYLS